MAKTKVAVIFGGASSEHDISLISAANIIKSIPTDKFEIIKIGITKKGRWFYFPGDVSEIENGNWENDPDCCSAILSPDPLHHGFIILDGGKANIKKVDVIFPVLHGKNGEDGTIQGLFELARIPYVGCGVLASAACMDKAVAHMILEYSGIPMAKWRQISIDKISHVDEICAKIADSLGGFPLFVKPANAGSSIGVSRADNLEELCEGAKNAFTHDTKIIIEECINGREIECAVFGNDNPFASFAGEIANEDGNFYDFDSKYVSKTKTVIPADIDFDVMMKIRETAVKAYKAIGCRGLSRVDFFLTDNNKILVNEINTLPGFTDISMYPKLMENLGMSQPYLIEKLIESALEDTNRNYF